MIRINLLPVREIKAEVGRRNDLIVAGLALALTAVMIVGIYLFQSYRRSSLEKELADLQSEIITLNVQVKEVGDLEKKISDLKSKLQVIENLNKKKIGPVRVMESLSSATPGRLWLTEFKESSGSLSLNGTAIDNQTIADFLRALARSVYFKDIDLIESSQDEKIRPAVKKFSVKGQLLYQPPPPPSDSKPKVEAPSQTQGRKRP